MNLSNQMESKCYSHKPGILSELTSNEGVNRLCATDHKEYMPSSNVSASIKVTDLAAAWMSINGSGEQDTA